MLGERVSGGGMNKRLTLIAPGILSRVINRDVRLLWTTRKARAGKRNSKILHRLFDHHRGFLYLLSTC